MDTPSIAIERVFERLNGQEYPLRVGQDIYQYARDHGVVIVFGESDDLVELRGAFYEELGGYDGCVFKVDGKGVIPCFEILDRDDETVLADYFARRDGGKEIRAIWCPPAHPETSWLFETEIPHKKFEIMEDGVVYCFGLIFLLSELA